MNAIPSTPSCLLTAMDRLVINDDNNNDIVEEKLKVDRKKFESLLDNKEPHFGGADAFFSRIMSELPSVVITWPPKLKSGTKSKKDPHVKISGIASMVNLARIKILDTLDPRRDRVTLKVDVDWTVHSHIIGRAGASIQTIMDTTGCHVHFPDANRTNNNEKSNQVSIAGTPSAVTVARSAIRDLMPVIVWFTLLLKSGNRSVFLDRLNQVIQLIEKTIKVQITIRFNAQTYSKGELPVITVLVRGVYRKCHLVKVGTELLLNFMGDFFLKEEIIYQINTEISGHHHSFILGFEQQNLKSLMKTTEAVITFPDQTDCLNDQDIITRLTQTSPPTPQPRSTTVNIKAKSVNSVLMAFQLVQLHLPLTLTFDLIEGHDVNTETMETLSNSYNVTISVKPKPKQKSKTLWIKAAEKDEWKLFEVRRHLISNHSDQTTPLSPQPSLTSKFDHSVWQPFRDSDDALASEVKPYERPATPEPTPDTNGCAPFNKAPGAERLTKRS